MGKLPKSATVQFAPGLCICRILNGMWQVSGAHGPINAESAIRSMFDLVDAGFTTWDLADIYGPAEDLIGEFRRRLSAERGVEAVAGIQAFTKWVPRRGWVERVPKSWVESNINMSLRRMDVETLDLLQFHWWDYDNENYLSALTCLSELRDAGKIGQLGLTNFDTEHVKRIIESGIHIVSNQVQFSLIDRRPEVAMIPFCRDHNIQLFAYGTLCGGLLSEKYLGVPEPKGEQLNTASLHKYKQMIDAWGDWERFQRLLSTLKEVASKHDVSIANVAVRSILEQPSVAGTIIGVRLGLTEHRADNARVFDFALNSEDHARINAVLLPARDLYDQIGDCGDEYRRR